MDEGVSSIFSTIFFAILLHYSEKMMKNNSLAVDDTTLNRYNVIKCFYMAILVPKQECRQPARNHRMIREGRLGKPPGGEEQ